MNIAARWKQSFSTLLVLGHLVNDMFGNLLSGLLPALTAVFGLSYLLAGGLAVAFNLTSSILQPLFGRWFDRARVIWLLELGIAMNCIGMSLVGISPSYTVLLILVATAGLGSAAFHPPAFSAVLRSSRSTRGGATGVFLSGGNTGFFIGPIMAGVLVSSYSLSGTLILLPVGLAVAFLLLKGRVSYVDESSVRPSSGQPINARVLGLLTGITAFRSVAIQTAVTFLPLYFVAEGYALVFATAFASIWLGVGVLGQLIGGFISDRIGRRVVIITSLFAGSFLFYGFLFTDGLLSIALLAASGAVLYASWSVIVVMSSEAAPDNLGMVSGFMLGFSVGIGGLAALGFGAVADAVGLWYTFDVFIAFGLIGGLLALFLPKATARASK